MTNDADDDAGPDELLAERVARLEDVLGGLEEMDDRDAVLIADQDEALARAARSGDLGPDWQAVQARVDAGRTTLADVFSGADTSAPAERLRQAATARLGAPHDRSAVRKPTPAALKRRRTQA